jgi:hypothetical protein
VISTRYGGRKTADRGALVIGTMLTVVDPESWSERTTTTGWGPFITWPPTSGKATT